MAEWIFKLGKQEELNKICTYVIGLLLDYRLVYEMLSLLALTNFGGGIAWIRGG